ncbi:MAG: radical SAM protein, partial [Myxococcales bacterium]|nr:radical SAM protein [Myxococcales bacterium]
MTRQTLRLTLECDNHCVFCAQRGLRSGEAPSYPALVDRLRALRERGDAVTFTGGEPSLAPRLPELVATARSLGFRAVGLQTNGRALADDALARSLVDAGLTDAHLSIHGPRAEVH